MKESQLVTLILRSLSNYPGIWVWRCNVGAVKMDNKRLVRFGFAGLSDIIGMYNGRFLAIECKVGRNKQTDAQKLFQERVERYGGLYLLAYSLDDVVRGLE